MRLYYKREGIALIHGDARDVVPKFKPDTFDALITDPPYGVEWQSSRRTEKFEQMAGDKDDSLAAEVVSRCLSALKHFRHVYVFGGIRLELLEKIGGNTELVWSKNHLGPGDLSLPWGPSHERIAFGVFAPSKANRDRGDGRLSARLRQGSVLTYARPNSRQVRHPSEKPVALLRQLIESSTCLGETVLDPFAGTGSTLVAALLEGRRAVGVELEERWCRVAAERLEAATLASE